MELLPCSVILNPEKTGCKIYNNRERKWGAGGLQSHQYKLLDFFKFTSRSLDQGIIVIAARKNSSLRSHLYKLLAFFLFTSRSFNWGIVCKFGKNRVSRIHGGG